MQSSASELDHGWQSSHSPPLRWVLGAEGDVRAGCIHSPEEGWGQRTEHCLRLWGARVWRCTLALESSEFQLYLTGCLRL